MKSYCLPENIVTTDDDKTQSGYVEVGMADDLAARDGQITSLQNAVAQLRMNTAQQLANKDALVDGMAQQLNQALSDLAVARRELTESRGRGDTL